MVTILRSPTSKAFSFISKECAIYNNERHRDDGELLSSFVNTSEEMLRVVVTTQHKQEKKAASFKSSFSSDQSKKAKQLHNTQHDHTIHKNNQKKVSTLSASARIVNRTQ